MKKKKSEVQKLVNKLDRIFSLYIRLRDANKSGMVKCCTSGNRLHYRSVDAGHFITRGDYATRWDERNVHAQSKRDNMRGGEQHKMALYIDNKYGAGTAEELQIKRHQTFKLDRVVLQEMIEDYEKKVKALQKEKGL